MKRLLLLLPLILLMGCDSPQKVARDSIAAAKGVLVTAQTKYQAQCSANPSEKPCVLIYRGVSAQNAAIDALALYCEGGTTPTFANGGPCVANKAAEPKLQQAIVDLNKIIGDVKGVL